MIWNCRMPPATWRNYQMIEIFSNSNWLRTKLLNVFLWFFFFFFSPFVIFPAPALPLRSMVFAANRRSSIKISRKMKRYGRLKKKKKRVESEKPETLKKWWKEKERNIAESRRHVWKTGRWSGEWLSGLVGSSVFRSNKKKILIPPI